MINRRIFSALLALCPAFVQRAIAAPTLESPLSNFCDEIIGILRRKRPDLMASAEIGPCEVRIEGRAVYLNNLAQRIAQQPSSEREAAVLEFIDNWVVGTRSLNETVDDTQSFAEIKSRLRPQIISNDYLDSPADPLFRPFSKKSSKAIVVDDANAFWFVRADQAEKWNVDFGDLEAVAIENLAAASEGAEISLHPEPGGVLSIVAVGDGYDAARLLVPAFRRRLLSAAGTALLAAIPTRDTLIIWTPGLRSFDQMQTIVHRFYEEGPYGRTDEIFEMKADSVTPI